MTGALLESRSSEVEVLVNGVLLCSQLRDQVVLVPLWKSLEPDEARQWFKKNGPLPAVLHAPLICAGSSGRSGVAGLPSGTSWQGHLS